MSKHDLKQQALQMRSKGMSYSQIKAALHVSKSSLSLWLKDYPLSEERIRLLRDFSHIRIEKFRKTMRAKRERRFGLMYVEEKEKQLPLSEKELFIAGLFLYWGEGLKGLAYALAIYNTNPDMINFALVWYVRSLHIPKEKIRVKLHLYSDMNIEKELGYWRKQLGLPKQNFVKPYIKSTKSAEITYKGLFGHGTCGLIVNDIKVKERVMAALKVFSDCYGQKI